jgi:CRP-like cAMP-binding protein
MSEVNWSDIAIFQDFSEQDLDKVKGIFGTRDIEAGARLIVEGSTGDEMYVLVSGRVRVTKSMIISGLRLPLEEVREPRQVLATLEGTTCPVFGEIALLDRDTRSATVEALSDCRFLVTDRDRFFSLVQREPVIGCRLLSTIGRRLASTVRKNNSELIKLTTALALSLSQSRGRDNV